MTPKVRGNIEIWEEGPDGEILWHDKFPMRSILYNFVRALQCITGNNQVGLTNNVIRQDGGVQGSTPSQYFNCTQAIGTTALVFGIVVGTGSVPVTLTDFRIPGLMLHGTGSNQLYYQPHVVDPFVQSGSVISFRTRRRVDNLSLIPYTITEMGCLGGIGAGTTNLTALFIRDVLGLPRLIATGSTIQFAVEITGQL